MPHIPDDRVHATHDLELIAAHAAGDATGRDQETATALLATCPECATLHADLRLIAAAVPTLPAPARRRDFRLTPEQAASLRPAGWRGLVATLAGPRFRFAAPMGTGLATIGIAALLVANLGATPLSGVGVAAPTDRSLTYQESGTASAAPAPSPAPTVRVPLLAPSPEVDTAGGGEPQATPVPEYDTAAGGEAPALTPSPWIDTTTGGGGADALDPGNVVTGIGDKSAPPTTEPLLRAAPPAEELRARGGDEILVIVGGTAALVGLALVALRFVSRRLT